VNVLYIQQSLSPIFRQYRIKKAILFGSFARGENSRRSDVDLILIKETPQRFFERYDGILADLNKAIPTIEVDALIYTPDELEHIAHRPFIAQALKEGKVIYESQ